MLFLWFCRKSSINAHCSSIMENKTQHELFASLVQYLMFVDTIHDIAHRNNNNSSTSACSNNNYSNSNYSNVMRTCQHTYLRKQYDYTVSKKVRNCHATSNSKIIAQQQLTAISGSRNAWIYRQLRTITRAHPHSSFCVERASCNTTAAHV